MEGYCFADSLAGRQELVLGALVIFLLAVNEQAIRSLNSFTLTFWHLNFTFKF